MDILDLQDEFKAHIEFIGDNECDYNLLTVKHFKPDNMGKDMKIERSVVLSNDAIRDIAIGLEAMAKVMRDYLND